MWSIMPSLVSQFPQSAAWILAWLSRNAVRSSGSPLRFGVEPQRHRRAGAEPGEHEIVGSRAAVEPADADRLVGEKAMPSDRDLLLESAAAGLAHDHGIGIVGQLRGVRGHLEIALRPGMDDVDDIARVAAGAQQMIGAGQQDEALDAWRR
jgi:hypothetical protein